MNFESFITNLAKSASKNEKPEKSHSELRESLELKLKSLKPSLQEGIKEYEQALKDDVFEDQDGEAEGSGEARKEALQKKLTALFDRAEKMKARLDSKEPLSQSVPEISTIYTHPNNKTETITLNIEQKLQDFLSFYQKTNIDLPADFEQTILDIWERNQSEIEEAIEQNGFDDILIVPGNIPLVDLAEKMKMENGYYFYQVKEDFSDAISQNVDKPRIILYHKKTLPEVHAETGLDVHLNIKAGDALKMFEQNPNEHMTLQDFIIMERKVFDESGIHISDYKKQSGQWLNTRVGTRLVDSIWDPDARKVIVGAYALELQFDALGVRPSRSYF